MIVTQKHRIGYWDTVKGILTVMVVAVHMLLRYKFYAPVKPIYDFLILFTMPAFVFVSGYLSRSPSASEDKTLFKLGVLYVLFNSLYILWFAFVSDYYQLTEPYYVHWYLIAMIVWRFVVSRFKPPKKALPLFVLAALLIGFWQDVGNEFAMSRIIGYFPFFLAGWLTDPDFVEKKLLNKSRLFAIPGCLLLIICLSVSALISLTYEDRYWLTWHYFMNYYTEPAHFLLRLAVFVLASLFTIGLLLTVSNSDKGPGILRKWGKNSLWIFLFHRPFTILFAEIFGTYSSSFYPAAILAAAAILILFGSDRFADLMNKHSNALIDALYNIKTLERKKRFVLTAVCWGFVLLILALPVKEYLF